MFRKLRKLRKFRKEVACASRPRAPCITTGFDYMGNFKSGNKIALTTPGTAQITGRFLSSIEAALGSVTLGGSGII